MIQDDLPMELTVKGFVRACHDMDTGATYFSVQPDLFSILPLRKGKNLGNDASGDVFLMEGSVNPKIRLAAKVYYLNNERQEVNAKSWGNFLKESAILQRLRHENIVKIIGPLCCPSYGAILMEYAEDGPLHEHLAKLPDTQAEKFFVQIASALNHVHSRRIVHRDIKVDNILVRKGEAILADFGLSVRLLGATRMVTGRVGTPNFMAPEVRVASRDTRYDGIKADCYSLGVVLWCMLMKDEPEDDTKLMSVLQRDGLATQIRRCILRLLRKHPGDRWTLPYILDYLKTSGYQNDLMHTLTN